MPIAIDELREKRIQQVRVFLSDFPHKNRLLPSEESDRDDLELAVDLSVDTFNNAWTPTTAFQLSNFPSLKLLIYGAVLELLTMKGIWHSRNRINYSDGGIQIAIHDKAPEYMKWIQALERTYEQMVGNKKMEINAAGCWGGMHSEYATTDYWY